MSDDRVLLRLKVPAHNDPGHANSLPWFAQQRPLRHQQNSLPSTILGLLEGMYTEVAGYVRSCRSCHFYKMPNEWPEGLQSCIPLASQAFEGMATDLLGSITRTESGHKYILNVTDQLIKWSISIPISDLTDDTTAEAIEDNIFIKYGAPSILISD